MVALRKGTWVWVRLIRCGIPNREAGAGGWRDLVLFPRVRGARSAGGWSICHGIRGLVVHLTDLRGLGGCGLLVLGRHGWGWGILRWGVQLLGPGRSGGWRVAGGCGLGVGL